MSQRFIYTAEVFFDELNGQGVLHHTRLMIHLERAQQKFFEPFRQAMEGYAQ